MVQLKNPIRQIRFAARYAATLSWLLLIAAQGVSHESEGIIGNTQQEDPAVLNDTISVSCRFLTARDFRACVDDLGCNEPTDLPFDIFDDSQQERPLSALTITEVEEYLEWSEVELPSAQTIRQVRQLDRSESFRINEWVTTITDQSAAPQLAVFHEDGTIYVVGFPGVRAGLRLCKPVPN